MKLGTEVGLGPGHIVLDGDPALPRPKRGAQPPFSGTHPLWSNDWIDGDAIWYGGRPRIRRHCVRWGLSSLSQNGGTAAPPHLSAHVLRPNGWMDQDATWYGGRPRPSQIVLDRDPAPPERGTAALPCFRSMSILAKLSSISATAEHLLHSLRHSPILCNVR